MTNNEAIDKLIMLKFAQALQAKAFSEDGKPLEPDFDIAVNMAIEALEKQIRKRVYLVSDGYADGYPVWEEYCPACDSELDGCSDYDFCPYCGQALDWSEEE